MFALKCEHVRFLQDFTVWPKCPKTEMAQTKKLRTCQALQFMGGQWFRH